MEGKSGMDLLTGKKRWTNVFACLAIVLGVQACSEEQGVAGGPVEEGYGGSKTAEIRSFLRHSQFGVLNLRLEALQTAAERDVAAESKLFEAYDAFGLMGASALSRLDDWVDETPDRQPPYLARASYYFFLGWEQRGRMVQRN